MEVLIVARSPNEVREKTRAFVSRHLESPAQGAHIQAAENFAEPVGSFLRRRNEVTTYEEFFMIDPALKEEERPALTDTTGLWDRGNPTMAGCWAKRKAR
jgi:hypothetical protein